MKIHYYIYLIIICSVITACENDDICAESNITTPQLIITFKDNLNQQESKAVESLGVYAIRDNQLILIESINSITTDSIAIPLRNDIEISEYKFYKNHSINDGVIEGEENHILLNYNTLEVFVSRACGFINNYIDLSIFTYDPSIFGPPITSWITGYEIVNPVIQNQNQAHVNIFH